MFFRDAGAAELFARQQTDRGGELVGIAVIFHDAGGASSDGANGCQQEDNPAKHGC